MYDEHRKLTYNQVIARDEKRFKAADKDGNEKLSREEYADFLHPGKGELMHFSNHSAQCIAHYVIAHIAVHLLATDCIVTTNIPI